MKPEKRPSWYLFVLLKNRWLLLKALLIVMIPTVAVTFILPKKFTVTSLIMPPETQNYSGLNIAGFGASDFAGYFSGGMGFSLPLMTTMSDVYEEILNSRTAIETVILSTNYLERIKRDDDYQRDEQVGLYWARKEFRKNFSANVTPSGFIEIKITTGDPMYSVEVSERLIAVLDSINAHINISRATQTRVFLEAKVSAADSIMLVISDSLKNFEREYGIVSLDDEVTVFIETLAELKQQYMQLLAQADAIRSGIVGRTPASALEKEREASALLDIITMLETGVIPYGYEEIAPALSLNEIPDIQFRYAILRADYETALELSSLLDVSLQQAIAEEQKEQPAVRVLDPPRHPGWKSKPKKLYIWLEVFFVAFILLYAYLLMCENLRIMKQENPEAYKDWDNLISDMKGDLKKKSPHK